MLRILTLALSIALLVSCSGGATDVTSSEKRITVETGRQFARYLVSGSYAEARSLLTQKLQKAYSPEDLAAHFRKMTEYWEGQPAKVGDHFEFMDEWPARGPTDLGWVYISISSDDYLEAVTVVVTDEDGAPKIREIEWGRP